MENKLTKEYLTELKKKVLNVKEPGEIEKILEHKTLYERFVDVAERKPDSIAIYYFGNKITYRQLKTLIDNAAKGFSELGIKYNDIVTCSLLATPYAIASIFALDKIGASMHLVNASSNIDELKRELNKVEEESGKKSKYFIATDLLVSNEEKRNELQKIGIEKIITTSLIDALPMGFNFDKLKFRIVQLKKKTFKIPYDLNSIFNFEQILNIGRQSKKDVEACSFVPNKLVTIAYTSGTTGNCKACAASWEKLDSMIQVMGMTELGRFEEDEIMFSTFPFWLYYSFENMLMEPLFLGVGVALDPLFNPKDIAKRNKQYHFNHWLTVPPYIKTMAEIGKKTDCSRWKIIVTGGSELSDDVKIAGDKYIRENGGTGEVVQGYGANELLGSAMYGYNENPTIGSVGKPCIGNIVKIRDLETGEELGPNQEGVAYVYSPAMMTGYYGDEEATKHNLIPDENGVMWYNTEDLQRYNERGEYFLTGRIRRIVLTLDSEGNPTKIIPERVKRCINTMDEVYKCEVITVPDETTVNEAIAFVVPKENVNDTMLADRIISHCKTSVPEYMVPKNIYFINDIPLLPTKKPDLTRLEQIYNDMKGDKRMESINVGKRKVRRLN